MIRYSAFAYFTLASLWIGFLAAKTGIISIEIETKNHGHMTLELHENSLCHAKESFSLLCLSIFLFSFSSGFFLKEASLPAALLAAFVRALLSGTFFLIAIFIKRRYVERMRIESKVVESRRG